MSVTEIANYLKVAAASIYAFDYVQTLPAEYRFYKRQAGFLRLSLACWLFVATRYLGMFCIIATCVGGFAKTFTLETCGKFFLVVPMLKVLASVASQGVFILRTYAICGYNKKILSILLVVGGLTSVAMIVAPVAVSRSPAVGPTGNCVSNLSKGSTSYVQYICQVIFDIMILGFTTSQIFVGMKREGQSDTMKVIWESQIMYFLVITASNIVNLVFFLKYNHSVNSVTFATMGVAITSVYSTHIILDLNEYAHRVENSSLEFPASGSVHFASANGKSTGQTSATFRPGNSVAHGHDVESQVALDAYTMEDRKREDKKELNLGVNIIGQDVSQDSRSWNAKEK